MKTILSSTILMLASLIVSACQMNGASVADAGPQPAVLAEAAAEQIDLLKSYLAGELNRNSIELGAGDPTTQPFVSVLPPPPGAFETRSLARPVIFDLWIGEEGCFAKHSETDEIVLLQGVNCQPAKT